MVFTILKCLYLDHDLSEIKRHTVIYVKVKTADQQTDVIYRKINTLNCRKCIKNRESFGGVGNKPSLP